MKDVNSITREEFWTAYNAHPETKFLKFMYTHYNVKLKRTPKPIGTWTAVISWIVATIGMILFNELGMRDIAMIFVWFYIPFGTLIFALPAFLMNKARIKKIIKILDVTPDQYNYLVNLYGSKED